MCDTGDHVSHSVLTKKWSMGTGFTEHSIAPQGIARSRGRLTWFTKLRFGANHAVWDVLWYRLVLRIRSGKQPLTDSYCCSVSGWLLGLPQAVGPKEARSVGVTAVTITTAGNLDMLLEPTRGDSVVWRLPACEWCQIATARRSIARASQAQDPALRASIKQAAV